MMAIEIPKEYPETGPICRIKNLAEGFLDNSHIYKLEDLLRDSIKENIGNPMLFQIIEDVRTELQVLNDEILKIQEKVEEKNSFKEGLKSVQVKTFMSYTPVNSETFGKWCEDYYERMKAEKEANLTDKDFKMTGKRIFEEK